LGTRRGINRAWPSSRDDLNGRRRGLVIAHNVDEEVLAVGRDIVHTARSGGTCAWRYSDARSAVPRPAVLALARCAQRWWDPRPAPSRARAWAVLESVNLGNVRTVQRGEHLRFTLESAGIWRLARDHEGTRPGGSSRRLRGPTSSRGRDTPRHAAGAQRSLDLVRADARSSRKRHGGRAGAIIQMTTPVGRRWLSSRRGRCLETGRNRSGRRARTRRRGAPVYRARGSQYHTTRR